MSKVPTPAAVLSQVKLSMCFFCNAAEEKLILFKGEGRDILLRPLDQKTFFIENKHYTAPKIQVFF